MSGKPRVLLADDHAAFVKEAGKLLEPEFEVVGVVNDGRAALEAARMLTPVVVHRVLYAR
jgi:CheY-like chemotaxis protein